GAAAAGGPSTVNPADRRARMMARLNQLPPAEREAALARLRAQGPDAASAGPAPGTPEPAIDIRNPRASTIDALFAPLPPTRSTGRVWMFSEGRLVPLTVGLGITDGTTTEVLSDNLPAGAEVVTSVSLDARRASAGTGGRSPLMGPTRPRGR
ncbi:MAG: hypothetical protein KGN76_01505, partial [Acidobacteriota bacterium]|nr:hypothetical protein [Acidobacteriota bacterium]